MPCSLFNTCSKYSLLAIVFLFFQSASAQQHSLPDTSKMAYNGLSTSLKLYVFPAKNQTQQQQKQDEFECYKWAMEQTGIDPKNPPKPTADTTKQGGGRGGGAVGGAAKGAAAGAAIGAIAGDAGEGAAIGAVGGALAGRRKKKATEAQAEKQAQSDVKNKEAEIMNSYIKAFSACIEGKGYTIK